MFLYRQLTRTLVLVSLILILIPVSADDWFWTGNCGGNNGWFSFCQTAVCNTNQPFNTNNWGRTACNAAPATPTIFDNVLFLNSSNALLNGDAQVVSVTIDGTSQLAIQYGRTLTLTGTLHSNQGVLLINNAGGFGVSTLLFTASATLTGSGGAIVMDANGSEAALNTADGVLLTNSVNHTIRGRGNINAALFNHGVIDANRGSSTVLNLLTNNKNNNGVMRASTGSFLDIHGIVIDQSSTGELLADGGIIRLNNATINGGILRTTGNNVIFSQTGTNTLHDVVLNGAHHIVNGRTTRITGSTFTNNGTVLVNTAGGFGVSTLLFDANINLTGSGEVVMDANGAEAALDTGTGFTVTNNQTIRGRGNINASLVNNGIINSNRGNNTVLNIQGANKTNNSVMRASTASFLDFNGGNDGMTITQTNNSQIVADAGQVRLNGNVTLVRGNFITQNGGIVFCANGTNTLQNFRNQGDYRIVNGRTTRITGSTFTNNGTVLVNTAGGFGVSTLLFDANINLTGSGEVVMDANGAEAALDTGTGFTVTNNQTIRGRGNINASLVNNGIINSNRGNNTVLNIQGANKTNNSVMKAGAAASFLDFNSITINQAANGEIHAEAGAVRLNNATINGGILRTTGNNVIFSQTGTNTLHDVVLNGAHHIVNGRTTRITGSAFTNNGTVLVNTAGGFGVSQLNFDSTVTLSGTGEVVMDANGSEAQLNVAGGVTLINPGSHTIRGRGHINVTGTMVNQGSLLANRGGNATLSINNAANFTNAGAVTVALGSLLATNDGDYKQVLGTTTVNGDMFINGGFKLDLRGGELRGTGTVTGNVECSQDGIVNPGNSTGTLNIRGNYTQTGTGTLKIEVAGTSAGQFDKLNISGNAPNGVANLDGILRVEFIEGFVPALGEQYRIIDCRLRTGMFQSVEAVNIPAGLAIQVNYATNNVTIEIVAGSTPGDVNGDGCVNEADLLAVLFVFGQTGERPEDLTGDNIVDDADLLEVLFNFGLGC